MASFEEKFNLSSSELKQIVTQHYADHHNDRDNNENYRFEISRAEIVLLNENNPAGFYGEHYILKVYVTTELDNWEEREISFFLKFMANDNEYLKNVHVFQKEIFMFQQLLPQLQKFRIGETQWAAKCYFIQNNNLLVFENLKESGYELCPSPNNNKSLDVQHIKLTLDTLANFHAASIAFEVKGGVSVLQQFSDNISENSYPSQPTTTRYITLQSYVEVLIELVKKIPKYESIFDSSIEMKFKNIFKKIHKFCEPSGLYRNVVNHGDLWKNNILFKYDVRDGEGLNQVHCNGLPINKLQRVPVDSILCDFQVSRFIPPAADVMTLLVINCKNLDMYLEELLDHYYNKLSTTLSQQLDRAEIDDILSREIFFKSCNDYKLFGLLESCIFNSTILLPQHLSVKLLKSQLNFDEFIKEKCRLKLCVEAFDTDYEFNRRMTDDLCRIIDDYILSEN